MENTPPTSPAREDVIVVEPKNTSAHSLRKIIRRIDELPLSTRFIMTVTKNDQGVLYWTVQEMGSIER